MSLLQRISRAYTTLSVPQRGSRELYGQQGEREAGQIIDLVPGSLRIANPIVPHLHSGTGVLEADYLVYAYGTLFCVEVKRWKNSTLTRKDAKTIIRTKIGNYGERIDAEERRDPRKQVGTFLHHFKDDLCRIDPRFRREHLVAVVAFSQETDISALYDFAGGLLALTDLPRFFLHHQKPGFSGAPVPWIVQALSRVYTWDVIETTSQQEWQGILREQELLFRGADGIHRLPFAKVQSIRLQRSGLFSPADTMTVHSTDGTAETLTCVSGEVVLDLPGNPTRSIAHKLRNVTMIRVGVANKQ